MFGDLKLLGRYAVNLRRHVSHPFSTAECEELLRRGMSTREQSFLRLLETVILAQPENPYRALLEHAASSSATSRRSWIRTASKAPSTCCTTRASTSPTTSTEGACPSGAAASSLPSTSTRRSTSAGGRSSSGEAAGREGRGRRNLQSLEGRTHDAAYVGSFLSAFGLTGRPALVWYPAPPTLSGIGNVLALTKAGNTPGTMGLSNARWMSSPSPRRLVYWSP